MIYDERECQKVMKSRGKTRYAIWFILLLAFLVSVATITIISVHADDSGSCGYNLTYTYTESNHTLTISGSGEMNNYSFYCQPWSSYITDIEYIVIENGVTSIGDCAFVDCGGIISLTIPDSVTSIGYFAFSGCIGLASITIPNSLTIIGDYAFDSCSSLTNITIPDDVESIGNSAFSYCRSLTTITIPEGVTTINNNTFYCCEKLTSVVLCDGLTTIGEGAFSGCNLSSIIIPKSVTNIGSRAFSGNINLIEIIVEEGNTHYYSSGHCLIETSTKTIINGCGTSIIPDDGSILKIEDCAFQDCQKLTNIVIPSSVTYIGDYAFSGCNISSITIPESVTYIGYSPLGGCNSLIEINVEEGNTHYYSSGNCLIETSTKTIINGCNTSTIPNDGSILCIGQEAFDRIYSISSIIIPESVTTIGIGAFRWCDGLSSIIIPSSVTSIGSGAFWNIYSLNEVYMLSMTPPHCADDTFGGIVNNCTFYVHGAEYVNGWSNIWDSLDRNNSPYTMIEMYSVDNVEGITTSSPIISHNGEDYYESGTEVTLSHGDYPGYIFEGYSVNGTPIEGNTFTMPDEDVTVKAILTKLEPVFYRHALVLSGEIGVKFRISFPEGFDPTDCYMDFVASDGRHSIVTFYNAEIINDSTDRYFTLFINALELAEDITATLHYGDDETIEDHYSAMTYIQYVCENMSTNETLVELVKALHTYGYYLQNSGWTDDKVSHVAIPVPAVLLTSTDIETAINGVSEKTVTKDLGDSGISNVKLSIKLNEMTVIKVLVKPADDSVIITTSGYTQVEIGNETYYQFETEGIGAKNLGNNYTITIETNKGTATVTASVMSYVKIALNSGGLSEAKQLTLAAFYQYHIAANNY